jgi:FMN reductase
MRRCTVAVVTAGLSQPSSTRLLADRLAAATEQVLTGRGLAVTVEFVELRDHARDVTNAALTGFPSPPLRAAIDAVVQADGLIAVSPIFNASYSGLFKSFFDVIDADSLTGTPVLIAATGGTERHSLALEHALRPLFSYLKALVVPTAVYAASSDWGPGERNHDALATRIHQAAEELADQVTRNSAGSPADALDAVVPFEQLLVTS